MAFYKHRIAGLLLAAMVLALAAFLAGCGGHTCGDTPTSHRLGCDEGLDSGGGGGNNG